MVARELEDLFGALDLSYCVTAEIVNDRFQDKRVGQAEGMLELPRQRRSFHCPCERAIRVPERAKRQPSRIEQGNTLVHAEAERQLAVLRSIVECDAPLGVLECRVELPPVLVGNGDVGKRRNL